MTTPFHRVRFLLQATRDVFVPGQQGAMLYALLCQANQQPESKPAFPRDFMLDAPEQTRTVIRHHDMFAFGGTLLATQPEQSRQFLERIAAGLRQLGQQGKPRREGLGGNFRLERCEDLVSGAACESAALTPLCGSHLDDELQRLQSQTRVSLRFLSPLRLERPRRAQQTRHSFFDDRFFDVEYFVRRLLRRMRTLGIESRDENAPLELSNSVVRLVENQLLWLDMGYGGERGKTLGGVVGRVELEVRDFRILAALVWGQYARLGKNTNFGFGRYRIEQLGPEPFACRRALGLLDTAWHQASADRLATQAQLEPGVLSHAIASIRDGQYNPEPPCRLTIGEGDKRRELQIPSRRDRVLQRLVLDAVAQGLDQLFESSSFAWRKGLSRHASARAIRRAYGQGYRYAVNADFDRFFDSIDHGILEARLRAYLGDDRAADLILLWVTTAMNGQGIPTGAPLSPLLGNLLLDRFDERIQERGGHLIRYGDDFLILCRDESLARQLAEAAVEEARQLELRLNDGAGVTLDLDEPFTFLGFRFERFDRWQRRGAERPQLMEELGWFDASKNQPRPAFRIELVGETGRRAHDFGLTAIVGPAATHLEVRPAEIHCHYTGGRPATVIPLQDLETLVVLGRIGLSSDVVADLTERQINVLLADERGNAFAHLAGDSDSPAELLVAQVKAIGDSVCARSIASKLVAAKLHNYSRLAGALAGGAELADELQKLTIRLADVQSLDELRGVEGHGAALWYRRLKEHLAHGFSFEHRVAPNANDPVNVLLNIAHTQLYRLTVLALRGAGLATTLGFLHSPNSRFQSLASDLQEPLRFLADRCVIQATRQLRPRDFRRDDRGPYPLVMTPEAARSFQLLLWRVLHQDVALGGEDTGASYLMWMQRQARSLRRHLLQSSHEFQAFRLP